MDLNVVNQSIPLSKIHKPALNDLNWSGCFCFLEEYDENILFKNNGVLAMKSTHKKNVAYLPKDSKIWVRNRSYNEAQFFKKFIYPIEYEGKLHWFSDISPFSSYRWVQMSVDLALERTRIWKQENDYIPEWLTEFYLMENQIKDLIFPSYKRFFIEYLRNIKDNIKSLVYRT